MPATMAMLRADARARREGRSEAAVAQAAVKSAEVGCQEVRKYSGRMARWQPCDAAERMKDSALEKLWCGERGCWEVFKM